ncbi:MAG: Crp/Fnr family transcriptional regulator [Brumimicrobium sp.]
MATEITKLWHVDAINLLEGIPYEEKVQFVELVETKSYKKSQFVFEDGEPSADIFFVVSGRVKIGKNATNGKECIKRIVVEGEPFGELNVIDKNHGEVRNDYAQVMDHDTVVCSMTYANFNKAVESHPILKERLIRGVIANYKRIDARLESIMFKDARTRLIEFINELSEDFGMPVGHEMLIKHRLTHQEIANITAISRQKITTLLNELKQEGLIHLERKSLLVHDMSLLK